MGLYNQSLNENIDNVQVNKKVGQGGTPAPVDTTIYVKQFAYIGDGEATRSINVGENALCACVEGMGSMGNYCRSNVFSMNTGETALCGRYANTNGNAGEIYCHVDTDDKNITFSGGSDAGNRYNNLNSTYHLTVFYAKESNNE